jgi:hypothetical protein
MFAVRTFVGVSDIYSCLDVSSHEVVHSILM